MKLITTFLTAAFIVSCGTESSQKQDEELKLKQITGDQLGAIDASEAPAQVISRIPVINGELQYDKAEVVELAAETAAASPDAVVNAFDGVENKTEVAELDADTSSNSWHYRYRRAYRWGYGYGYARGCGWGGCGYSRSVYYGTRYSYRGKYYGAYRPYRYSFGCRRGGYYYASYTRGSSWYSYGRPACTGFACGSYGSYGSYGTFSSTTSYAY